MSVAAFVWVLLATLDFHLFHNLLKPLTKQFLEVPAVSIITVFLRLHFEQLFLCKNIEQLMPLTAQEITGGYAKRN